jgi:hypothetical protein
MTSPYLPRTHREGVLSRAVGTETVVYDPVNHGAHCLNAPAAFVWQHADGTRSVAELARELADHLHMPHDDGLVWLALGELQRANLLADAAKTTDAHFQPDRRQALAALARYSALALLVPAVTSVVIPTAAASSSCLEAGEFCVSGIECCSGICFAGMCTG